MNASVNTLAILGHLNGLVITSINHQGNELFNSYFHCIKDLINEVHRDEWKRLYNHVLALDAFKFTNFRSQFEEFKVRRELTKCYCGFKSESKAIEIETNQIKHAAIATGNWGCGAFGGDKELKCLKRFN